jgi:hypothetical protein
MAKAALQQQNRLQPGATLPSVLFPDEEAVKELQVEWAIPEPQQASAGDLSKFMLPPGTDFFDSLAFPNARDIDVKPRGSKTVSARRKQSEFDWEKLAF